MFGAEVGAELRSANPPERNLKPDLSFFCSLTGRLLLHWQAILTIIEQVAIGERVS